MQHFLTYPQLEQKAKVIRGRILDQIVAFKNGHVASAFSSVEILLSLYHGVLRVDPRAPQWPDRDRLILSKGHGVSALYAILADLGFFPYTWLTAPQEGNALGGHADRKVPGIDWSTGSLGHGLSVAVGMALAAKMNKKNYRVFCLLGDGELQEGSVWEAAMFAAHHKLTNLIAIVDQNSYQSCGKVDEIIKGPLLESWSAFGWDPYVVYDGHDFAELQVAFRNRVLCEVNRWPKPIVILAHTQKGHGVSFIKTGDKWHTGIPTDAEILVAKKELSLI